MTGSWDTVEAARLPKEIILLGATKTMLKRGLLDQWRLSQISCPCCILVRIRLCWKVLTRTMLSRGAIYVPCGGFLCGYTPHSSVPVLSGTDECESAVSGPTWFYNCEVNSKSDKGSQACRGRSLLVASCS